MAYSLLKRSPRCYDFSEGISQPLHAESVVETFKNHLHKFTRERCKDANIDISEVDWSTFKLAQLQTIAKHYCIHSFKQPNKCWYQCRKLVSTDISHAKLFDVAKRNAVNQSTGFSTAKGRERYIVTNGNVVFISGKAGAGKTIMSKYLIHEMLNPKIKLYDAAYVFFLKFCDTNFNKKMDLLEFLVPQSFIDNYTDEDRETILNDLGRCRNVVLVMDGLDETSIDLKLYPNCSIHSFTTAAIFIKNLLNGNIFPHCKKIITTRPRALMLLGSDLISSKLIFTIGLNESHKQVFLDKSLFNGVWRIRSDLRSFSHIHNNCILVMRNLNASAGLFPLITLTSILVASLPLWCWEKLESEIEMKMISSLAYKQFQKDELNSEKDLLVNEYENYLLHTTNQFTFQLFRELWLEFFVAVKFRLYTDKGEFKSILEKLSTDKWKIVTNILFGLCNKTTLSELVKQVKQEECNLETECNECREMLKQFALKKLQMHFGTNSLQYFPSIFPVLEWLHEMQDNDYTAMAAVTLKNEILLHGKLSYYEIKILNYVLCNRKFGLSLNVQRPDFIENSFQYFISELSVTLGRNPNIQISRFNLFKVDVDTDIIQTISKWVSCMNELELQNCNLCKEKISLIQLLTGAIAKKATPLLKLNFSWNYFFDEGAYCLLQCIHNIEELDLGNCRISHKGILHLSQAIAERKCPMKRLSLQGNFLGDEGAKHLAKAVHNIQELNLKLCAVHKDGVAALVEQIKDLSSLMQELCLDLCAIGDEGIEHFFNCVGKIFKLSVFKCQLSHNMCERLKEAYNENLLIC